MNVAQFFISFIFSLIPTSALIFCFEIKAIGSIRVSCKHLNEYFTEFLYIKKKRYIWNDYKADDDQVFYFILLYLFHNSSLMFLIILNSSFFIILHAFFLSHFILRVRFNERECISSSAVHIFCIEAASILKFNEFLIVFLKDFLRNNSLEFI